ncbi:MAG: DNA polymerase I [Clostridia bacterium]|nr:DNA polymerase I [Clostridia bacterium]
MPQQKMILIDGNSLIHRAFYALPLLSNKQGVYTNAVYGFLNMMFKVIDQEKPDYIGVAFDRKAPTFRHEQYDEYKAGRKKTPDELVSQIELLKKVLSSMGIRMFEIDGFEADDVLGTLAKRAECEKINALIVTGDRDALQLASDYIHIIITKKGITNVEKYTKEQIEKTYGITAEQMVDLKGLMGDKSDNIPGIPGVGEKTALKLLKQFDTLENVLDNKDKVSGKKLKENIEKYQEQALMSRELARIVTDVPIESDFSQCTFKDYKNQQVYQIFKELEFNSLIDRMGFDFDTNKSNLQRKIEDVCDWQGINKIKDNIRKNGKMAINIGRDVIISYDDKHIFRIKLVQDLLSKGMDYNKFLKAFKDIFEDESISIYGHDLKQLLIELNKNNIELKGIAFDTMIAAYVIEPTRASYKLEELAIDYGISSGDIVDIMQLKDVLNSRLKDDDLERLFYDIELPLIQVLADMEIYGFRADKKILKQLKDEFSERISELEQRIYQIAGEKFNINSPKQLGIILFEKLNLPVVKKTKTGYSTDIEVLEKLLDRHEIIEYIIEYRHMAKLRSTYIDGLINVINPMTGRIHSSFNQTVTSTGRISSTEPNLQNIPIKMEQGRQIRKVFKPDNDDFLILSADYSQIELRVLAHISEDENLIDSFIKGQDVHTRTASQIFDVPIDKVTPSMRSDAKAVNFGIVYGISDFGLARNLNISRKKAKEYIDSYFNKYSGVKKYMDNIVKFAERNGYVTTLFNRRRDLPELKSRNYNIRTFGERIAMNTPIQGTAADIIKKAMIKVYANLKSRHMQTKLILQVHDELILEVFKPELDVVKDMVKHTMESIVELKVPLLVDINVGETWYDAK